VNPGQRVKPTTVIGYVGNEKGDPKAGNTHVHIEITDWEYTYNVVNFLSPEMRDALISLAGGIDAINRSFNTGNLETQPYQICRINSETPYETCPP
jgi:murein DD-endopeptidase MepM/ murein hydrolase activator NlpD